MEIDSMDNQLRQDDHDAIVSLTATSKLGFAEVKSDIADLKTLIAEFKGTFSTQYAALDVRVKTLEDLALKFNPEESLKKIQKHDDFVNDYVSTHKERTSLWGFWFSVVSLAIAAFSTFSKYIIK